MPTRCNRGFYCRSYCLLNMFRAPLCPSSGAEDYTVVAPCGIWCWVFQVVCLVWSWGLCVRIAGCCSKYHRVQPLYNNLELLMMGIVVPEKCWARNKICNKNLCCIYLAFYFHILTTMHGQNHIKLLHTYIVGLVIVFFKWPIATIHERLYRDTEVCV